MIQRAFPVGGKFNYRKSSILKNFGGGSATGDGGLAPLFASTAESQRTPPREDKERPGSRIHASCPAPPVLRVRRRRIRRPWSGGIRETSRYRCHRCHGSLPCGPPRPPKEDGAAPRRRRGSGRAIEVESSGHGRGDGHRGGRRVCFEVLRYNPAKGPRTTPESLHGPLRVMSAFSFSCTRAQSGQAEQQSSDLTSRQRPEDHCFLFERWSCLEMHSNLAKGLDASGDPGSLHLRGVPAASSPPEIPTFYSTEPFLARRLSNVKVSNT